MIPDETVDPSEEFVSLAQERDTRFLDGTRVVVVGSDRDLGIRVGAALRLHGLGTEMIVHVVEARDALEGLAEQLKAAAAQTVDFEKAFHAEATRCRIVTTPYQYVPPTRFKQKAQWKQERSRVRRR